jgi:flavodoxin
MKILVAYLSETGNTEKLAKAIFESVTGDAKDLLTFDKVASVEDYDLIFCGFPVQAHSVPGKAQKFIKAIPKGKKVAFFITHGSQRGGEFATTALHHAGSLAVDLKILGTFGSRGKVKDEIIEFLASKPEHRVWAEEARNAAAHPDEADLHDVADFAREILLKARHG